MQKLIKEPPSPIVIAPRQLEPLTRHRHPTTASDIPFSPIHNGSQHTASTPTLGTTNRRESHRNTLFEGATTTTTTTTTTADNLVPHAKRQSIVQRKQSNVRRASTRHGIIPTHTKLGRSSTSPLRGFSIRGRLLNNGEKNQHGEQDGDPDESVNDSDDSDDDDGRDDHANLNMYDSRMAAKLYKESQAVSVYEDHGKKYTGFIDRRGITPFVTFTTTETPPSQAANRILLDATRKPTCGFCSSSNLVWILRCSFCGCARMGDAPRLKYLIDMVLSVNPTIAPAELAKRVLEFAKFDHVAMKVEEKFKQASLVRAKAAIMMMSRTIAMLRQQTMRMIFTAWRGNNAIQASHDVIMKRLIKIKDIQVKARNRGQVFAMWRGYVDRIAEERSQRLAIASKRNDLTKLRRLWMFWQTFMRMRAREKLQQLKAHHEAERRETPNEYLMEIGRLKETVAESRRLVFAATNAMLELLHQSIRFADSDVQKVLELKRLYPTTAGTFFESVYGDKILDGLRNGHIATGVEFAIDDAAMDALVAGNLETTRATIERMPSSSSLIQWLNFQRQRAAAASRLPVVVASSTPESSSFSSSSPSKPTASSSAATRRPSAKLKTKEKVKEAKEIKSLQDLRARISSPAVMLKLLCHTSSEARTEYHKFRATESSSLVAAIAAENSTTSTTLTPAAQVQLKAYFKMVVRLLNLPSDVITKDAFVLNDFDSLYAYAVYLFTFHPNYIAPGLPLSPRDHLDFQFFVPQWGTIQKKLTDDAFDPFAQQQFYIFLAKIKKVSKQFMRFESICRGVDQIAQWHQLATLRDTYNDLTRRALGKDSNISIALEKETLAAWVALPAAKLLSMCDGDDELRQIENVFKDNVLDLVKIFRIYGSGSGGKGILEQEFLKVMTRAGVTDKKNILRSHLQLIYQQARQPGTLGQSSSTVALTTSTAASPGGFPTNSPGASPGTADNDDDDGDTGGEDRGATPNEFFEALVRVAHHNYQKRRLLPAMGGAQATPGDAVSGPSANPQSAFGPGSPTVGFSNPNPSPSSSLLAQVVELVVDKIVPLTKKFQEQGLMFKKQMVHPDVQYVCKAQERRLKRVFLTYSQKNKNPGSRGKLMDLSDFEALLKDKRLVDALFPHGKIKQLVSFVQQDGDLSSMGSGSGGSGGLDSDTEFVFAEFVEALAAITVFRNANPYIPLSKKFETFIEENL